MRKFLINAPLFLIITLFSISSLSDGEHSYSGEQSGLINIKSSNGKFYAYIVLLFNENPHFVNLVQENSIPVNLMQNEDFHIVAYKNYLKSMRDDNIKKDVELMLDIYMNPSKYKPLALQQIAQNLESKNIVLKFIMPIQGQRDHIMLEYCIYGKKRICDTKHPFFTINEKIYNIQPLIYYDELSTSNSTFYFDMIYINHEEVNMDYLISKKILNNEKVSSMLFVGARVTPDIKFCIQKAFTRGQSDIKNEILKMFEIHELTHKVLNNNYNFFDPVIGEEFALSSTIYANPYLGMAVMYSYLDYNAINPHRIAAINYIRSIANQTGNTKMIDNPSLLRDLPMSEIMTLTKNHFNALTQILQQ